MATLESAIEACTGRPVQHRRAIGGGDVGQSFEVLLSDGQRCFVKHYPRGPEGVDMAGCEARGLAWLGEPGCIAVARPLGASADGRTLVLEWVDSAPCAADHDERLGLGLAALHAAGAPAFGLAERGCIGSLPQDNTSEPSWCDFYRERRLRPQLRMARDAGLIDASSMRRAEGLLMRLEELFGTDEPPARLHGDLWSGNAMTDEAGAPCLIDPAAYGGHREMDLAMMRLFGGFSRRTFEAYDEAFPLAPGSADRIALCQLYPTLVHVNLFGGGYVASYEAIVRRYG